MCNGEWGSWGDGLGFVGCWGEWRSCRENKSAQKSFCSVFSVKVWTLPCQKLLDPPLLYMMQSTIRTEIYFRTIRKKYIWTNLHSTESSWSNVSVYTSRNKPRLWNYHIKSMWNAHRVQIEKFKCMQNLPWKKVTEINERLFLCEKYHSEEVWKGGEKSLNIYNFITNEYLIRNTYCCQLPLCSRTKLLIKCREGNSFSSPKSPYFTIQCLYSIIIVSGKIYYIKHLNKLVFLYSF